MKIRIKSILLILSVIIIAALVFTACGETTPTATTPATQSTATPTPTSSTPTPNYGGTIRYIDQFSVGQPLGTPWEANLATPVYQFAFEKILGQGEAGAIGPELCSSYDVDTSKENPSVTLHIRKGVKFHDGTDLNAKSMKWNLDKFKNSGIWPITKFQKSYDIVDDYTIKIPLTEWRNMFLSTFVGIQGYVASPTAFETKGEEWMRWNQVGCGPFVQQSFQRDVSWIGTKFADYWDKGKPYVDKIENIFVSDETTRIALWKSGGGDVMGVSARYASEFKAAGYPISGQVGQVWCLMPDGMNANSPWSNKKVREAADYALDKEALSKAYGYGFGDPAYQVPASNSTAYNPDIPGRKYDQAKARALLTEAGYPTGFKTKLICPSSTDTLVAIKSMLDAVGIQTELEVTGFAKFSTYMAGSWENALLSGSIIQIANYNQTFNNFISSPPALYKSCKLPDNWATLYFDTVTSKQIDPKLQQKAVKALYDEVSFIPYQYGMGLSVVNPKLVGHSIGKKFYWDSQNAYYLK